MLTNILLLIFGLILLIAGGEFLVKSAVSFAKKLNVSPFLIGVTIVSFGTSAPELMVSIQAAFDGAAGISVGNVIGSNIANIGLVLGLTAIVKPIIIENKKYIVSWFFMFGAAILMFPIINNPFGDGVEVSFFEGLFLVFCLLVFIIVSIKFIKIDDSDVDTDQDFKVLISLLFLFLGSAGLYLGSELFVSNSIVIARSVGISEFVIGVTIVAFGTSLPELVTSVVAVFRGQNSISIGNLIGSNIFNVFAVLGITSIVKPLFSEFYDSGTILSIVFMVCISLLMGLYLFFGKKISRLKGVILLAGYIIYIVYSFI